MTLSDLCTEVYNLTGRPDRVAETVSAVKSATLKMHHIDYWYKDIVESGVSFSSAAYLQSLEYRTVFPTWRALKYIRKYDLVNSTPGKILDLITPDGLFDRYSIQKTDVAYVAGAYLQINSSSQDTDFILGYYAHPVITDSGYNSWIALDHPFAIIYDAAATVFKAVGKDEEAAQYRKLVEEQVSLVRTSNLVANGF